jgi:hypothetical protein
MSGDPVAIARLFGFVREAQSLGQNHGQRVNAIQIWSGGPSALNTSWCCWFVTMVLDLCFQGDAPIPRGGSCQAIYDLANAKGWVSNVPAPGDLFLYVNAADHAHHVGIVTTTDPLTGIAGNTSSDGTSSNGDGVYEHGFQARVFVKYPR